MNLIVAVLAFCVYQAFGETCQAPQVTSQIYTTSEVHVSTETVVIITFSVQCKTEVKDLTLYAEFDGRNFPVSQYTDSDKYQVSFSIDHKKLPAGHYQIRFFDEDLYANLRKAQRSGEDASSIQGLFTISFNHQGASHGPWIQTEHVAVLVSVLLSYFAYSTRSQLQS